MKKYEFTGETKVVFGRALRRIKAVVKFGAVEAGELGGWIEKEENLSHSGNAWVSGNAEVYGNAEVFRMSHLLVIGPVGSRNSFTTFCRDKDNEITVKCGCFLGKIDEFLQKVAQTHGDSKYALVYRAAVEVAKTHIDLSKEVEREE